MAAYGFARLRLETSTKKRDPDDLGLRDGLHPIVEFALGFAARDFDGADHPTLDHFPNIAGVVVLHDSNEEIKSESERG